MPGSADLPTAGGYLLVLAIMLPAGCVLLALLFGGRHAERIALAMLPMLALLIVALTIYLRRE